MEDYKPELRRQSSEKVMWDAVLKDGKKSPSEQNIVDIFNRTGLSIKDAQQQARKEIEKKKKSTPMEKKELDEFLKKTKANPGNANPFKKELAIKATENTKRYKESKNMSKRLHKKTGGRRTRKKRKGGRKRKCCKCKRCTKKCPCKRKSKCLKRCKCMKRKTKRKYKKRNQRGCNRKK